MAQSPEARQVLTDEILTGMAVLVRGIRQNFPTTVDALDITMRQCRAIMFLTDGPTSMSKLAAAIGASLPSTTGLVDRLVQRGFVLRHEDPHDRRLVICELAEQGREVLQLLQDADRMVFSTLFARLTTTELETVQRAVELLAREVREQAIQNPPSPVAAT